MCPNNGNLLASSGDYGSVKIFDKREAKVVKSFGGLISSEEVLPDWTNLLQILFINFSFFAYLTTLL